MRHLSSNGPPLNYAQWVAANPNATWDEVRDAGQGAIYNELRGNLMTQQNSLCAFCEIDLVASDVEIEHWHPKSDPARPPNWAIDFDNLQAGCKGGASNQHRWRDQQNRFFEYDSGNLSCGAKKGEVYPENVGLYHPRDIPHSPPVFWVDFEGVLRVNEPNCHVIGIDPVRAAITIETLGLDCPRLRRARSEWWHKVSEDMIELIESYSAEEIASRYLSASQTGDLPRFFTTLRSMFGTVAERLLG